MKTKLVKQVDNLLPYSSPVRWSPWLLQKGRPREWTEDGRGGRLQGTWDMQITLTDCAGHVIRSFPSTSGIRRQEAQSWSRTRGHRRL